MVRSSDNSLRRLADCEPLPLFKAEQERGASCPLPEQIVELAGMRRRQRAYRHRVAEASPSRTGTRTTSWAC